MTLDSDLIESVNHVLFWVGIFWLFMYGSILFINKGIPNVETAPPIRKRAVELLTEDFKTRGLANYTIVDVGSGNGRFSREIAKALPNARVVGLETVPHCVWWSRAVAKLQKLTNLEYWRGDFMKYDFAKVDAMVMYLSAYVASEIGKKLTAEAKPGTFIISNNFRLCNGWEPVETLEIQTVYPQQKNVYSYRKA